LAVPIAGLPIRAPWTYDIDCHDDLLRAQLPARLPAFAVTGRASAGGDVRHISPVRGGRHYKRPWQTKIGMPVIPWVAGRGPGAVRRGVGESLGLPQPSSPPIDTEAARRMGQQNADFSGLESAWTFRPEGMSGWAGPKVPDVPNRHEAFPLSSGFGSCRMRGIADTRWGRVYSPGSLARVRASRMCRSRVDGNCAVL